MASNFASGSRVFGRAQAPPPPSSRENHPLNPYHRGFDRSTLPRFSYEDEQRMHNAAAVLESFQLQVWHAGQKNESLAHTRHRFEHQLYFPPAHHTRSQYRAATGGDMPGRSPLMVDAARRGVRYWNQDSQRIAQQLRVARGGAAGKRRAELGKRAWETDDEGDVADDLDEGEERPAWVERNEITKEDRERIRVGAVFYPMKRKAVVKREPEEKKEMTAEEVYSEHLRKLDAEGPPDDHSNDESDEDDEDNDDEDEDEDGMDTD